MTGHTGINWKDRIMYILIIASFLGVLCVPFISFPTSNSLPAHIINHQCIWKHITRLPCPTCGYTRSIRALARGNIKDSILYQPLALIYLAFFAWLAFMSAYALVTGKAFTISNRAGILIFIILGIGWIIKLLLPMQYW
jgi:hypothetical protein